MTEVLLVIPARGGSKGIPGKNLQPVGGLPLIARAIRAGLRSRLVTRMAVSTDCDAIAECASRFGAEVIRRPASLSGDSATSESALMHALEHFRERTGTEPGILVMVQCTAPFIAPEDIDGAVDLVLSGQADSAFAACQFKHYIWQQDEDGWVQGVSEAKGQRKRRQDARVQYLEAGSVYAMRVETFVRDGHRFCGRTKLHEIPAERCFEIDTSTELEHARLLETRLARRLERNRLPESIDAIVFDFDGVMTDDQVTVFEDGRESVRCSRSDGMGIERLRQAGIRMLVLSKEQNPVVTARCRKLKLEVLQGRDDKLADLQHWVTGNALNQERIIYMGNDINDLACMRWVGAAVAPAKAHPEVLASADVVVGQPGGRGAVRALADLLLG